MRQPVCVSMEVEGASKVAVFLHGTVGGGTEEVWYRLELEKTLPKNISKIRRKNFSPVAAISSEKYGHGGSWDVIGDDIYWIGGHKLDSEGIFLVCSNQLLKHNINSSSDPRIWETVSTSMKIPRAGPFVAAVGEKKLYVVLGTAHRPLDEDEDLAHFGNVDWNRCGEVYDIEDKTWNYLDPDYEEFSDYSNLTFYTASVNGEEDDEPRGVAFCNLYHPILYFNFCKQTVQVAPDFCLTGCNKAFSRINNLGHALMNFDGVFDSNTFYWFTRDLQLCGYDISCQTWFISPSFEDKLHILQGEPLYPSLACLGKGNFVVIVDERGDHPGNYTMASFTVHKNKDDKDEGGNCFLSVTMKSLQTFSIDDHRFYPLTAKAKKLKNTAMNGQLQVMDNICDFYRPIRKMKKIVSTTKVFILTFAVVGVGVLLFKRRN